MRYRYFDQHPLMYSRLHPWNRTCPHNKLWLNNRFTLSTLSCLTPRIWDFGADFELGNTRLTTYIPSRKVSWYFRNPQVVCLSFRTMKSVGLNFFDLLKFIYFSVSFASRCFSFCVKLLCVGRSRWVIKSSFYIGSFNQYRIKQLSTFLLWEWKFIMKLWFLVWIGESLDWARI